MVKEVKPGDIVYCLNPNTSWVEKVKVGEFEPGKFVIPVLFHYDPTNRTEYVVWELSMSELYKDELEARNAELDVLMNRIDGAVKHMRECKRRIDALLRKKETK